MQNTIWSAVAGSTYQMRRLDVIANNLANVNTVGFRADRVDFSAYLAQIRDRQFDSARRGLRDINDMIQTRTTKSNGVIQPTNNPLDMALNGPGFFVVSGPDGERYTRAGDFRTDAEGQLTTADGELVLGDGGPIQLREDAGTPEVTEEGAVFQNGEEIGRLRIVEFENPDSLVKVSGRAFRAGRNTQIIENTGTAVVPRSLEGSNVNMMREMVAIVQAERAFDSYQRVISLVNTINQAANNRIPQVG